MMDEMAGKSVGDIKVINGYFHYKSERMKYWCSCLKCGKTLSIDAEWLHKGLIVTHKYCDDGEFRRVKNKLRNLCSAYKSVAEQEVDIDELKNKLIELIVPFVNEYGTRIKLTLKKVNEDEPFSLNNICLVEYSLKKQQNSSVETTLNSNTQKLAVETTLNRNTQKLEVDSVQKLKEGIDTLRDSIKQMPVQIIIEDDKLLFEKLSAMGKYGLFENSEIGNIADLLVMAVIKNNTKEIRYNGYTIELGKQSINVQVSNKNIKLVGDLYILGEKDYLKSTQYLCKCRVCNQERFVRKYLIDGGLIVSHKDCNTIGIDAIIHNKLNNIYSAIFSSGLLGKSFVTRQDFCEYIAKQFIQVAKNKEELKNIIVIRKDYQKCFEKNNTICLYLEDKSIERDTPVDETEQNSQSEDGPVQDTQEIKAEELSKEKEELAIVDNNIESEPIIIDNIFTGEIIQQFKVGQKIGDAIIIKVINKDNQLKYVYKCSVCGKYGSMDAIWLDNGLIIKHSYCDLETPLGTILNEIVYQEATNFRVFTNQNISHYDFSLVVVPTLIQLINKDNDINKGYIIEKIDTSKEYSLDNIMWVTPDIKEQVSDNSEFISNIKDIPVYLITGTDRLTCENIAEFEDYDILDYKEFEDKLKQLWYNDKLKDSGFRCGKCWVIVQNNTVDVFILGKKPKLVGDLYVLGKKPNDSLGYYICKCKICNKKRKVIDYLIDNGLIVLHNDCEDMDFDKAIHRKLGDLYDKNLSLGLIDRQLLGKMNFSKYVSKYFIKAMYKSGTFGNIGVYSRGKLLEKGRIYCDTEKRPKGKLVK